jgi:hypothetical protein
MVACPHCQLDVSPRAQACPRCGEPGPAYSAFVAPPPTSARGTVESVMASVNRTEPYAIASIVCAVGNFVGLFLIGAVLAVIFGKMAERRIDENPALEGAGLARAGIVVGWVGVGVVMAMILLGITAFGVFTSAGDLPVRFTS